MSQVLHRENIMFKAGLHTVNNVYKAGLYNANTMLQPCLQIFSSDYCDGALKFLILAV